MMRPLYHVIKTTLCILTISITTSASARDAVLFNSEQEIPFAELLDLLDLGGLGNLLNTTATVSATENGTYGATANATPDGRLSCRAEGDDIYLVAGAGPSVSGTCYAQVCYRLVGGLIDICKKGPITFASAACLEAGPGAIDPGCARAAPICQGTGANAQCIGCQSDVDCGNPTGTFGLGLGEVANVSLGLLNQLAGLDLGLPLSTVQVGANVNGLFSDEATLASGITCGIAADGSVELVADSALEGQSTCFVQVCAPLLNQCLIVPLDILVEGCLLGDECDTVNACDVVTHTCVECRDNREAGFIDSGCSNDLPVCIGSGAEVHCAACESDVDCSGKLLNVGLGPNRTTVIELARILDVLNLASTVVPTNVGVSAAANGPFNDEALLAADSVLSGCTVDAAGNVLLAAAGVEGHAVCHVQVCASLLGNTVESCLSVPIDVTVAACVLDRSCDISPRCDASNQCVSTCQDSAAAGAIDRGCSADLPACGGDATCLECQADADCAPKRPLLFLDLSDVGTIPVEDILTALKLELGVLVDSLHVGATVDGPFADTTTLDVQGDVASCFVNADSDVEVIATTTIYGSVTCYVEVCVGLLEAANTCAVLPVEVNVDPCATTDTCRPPICDSGHNTCVACIDTVVGGVDQGCGVSDPACVSDAGGDHCAACEVSADCATGNVCTADHRCVACTDNTAGGLDAGCTTAAHACDEAPLVGVTPVCVACTVDADCGSGLCDEATRTCKDCQDTQTGAGTDAGCTAAEPLCLLDAAANHCEECKDTVVGAGMDLGCSAGAPICLTGVGGEGHCEECLTTADCGAGLVCSANHTCEACLDNTAGGLDQGCAEPLAACDAAPIGGGDNACVECTVDADCDTNLCNEATRKCEACQDTAAGNALDAGCTSGEPMCLPGAGGNHCEECNTNADCAAGEYCSDLKTCEGCSDTSAGGVDAGCGVALPACDVAPLVGTSPTCVECTVDADCESDLCDEASRTCIDCADTAAGAGVDDGCSAALPMCVSIEDRERCVECTQDSDCDASEQCRVASGTCAPVAAVTALDDSYQTAFNTALVTSAATGVLMNDSGPNGATVTVSLATAPNAAQGTVVLAADGSFVFTPASGFSGTATFTYLAASGGQSDTASVTIEVGANAPPVGGDDEAATPEDTAVVINVLANDSDPEGQAIHVESVGTPRVGLASILPDNTVLYTPPADYTGLDMFNYMVCDAFGDCHEATVVIMVLPVNDAPHAADDFAQIASDTSVDIDVLFNDGDPDGDALSIGRVDVQGLDGTASIVGGVIHFVAAAGFTGTTQFSYEACDAGGLCDTATVVVRVGEEVIPMALAAVDDAITTPENVAVAFNVLTNDTSLDGARIAVMAWAAPKFGSVSGTSDGAMIYRPNPGFIGTDTFSYTACVAHQCDVAIVTITMMDDGNGPPVAIDDTVTTVVDTPIIVTPTLNDFDPDGDTLSVLTVGTPLFGTAVLRADGGIDYTPAVGFLGVDMFEVEISDGHGGMDHSTVTVMVIPAANTAPVANDDAYELSPTPTTAEGTTHHLAVLANDSDPDGDPLVIDVIVQPHHGVALLAADGNINYTPDSGYSGPDTLTYRVSDGRGGFDSATVTITLTGLNAAPEVLDDAVEVLEDTPIVIDVLANDSDPDGGSLTATLETDAANGSVVPVAGGFEYTPDADYFGEDSFTYEACDADGACATATVTVTVLPVNDAPVARDDLGTGTAGEATIVDVLANDSDVDGDTLVVGAIMPPDTGTATLQADGRIAVLAPAGFSGTVIFLYDACDPSGLCARATVSIAVSGDSNRAPEAMDDQAEIEANNKALVDVLANDTDPDGDTLSIKSVSQPTHGTNRVVDNKVEYTPADGFVGVDSFQYIVCDLSDVCDTARVSITVTIPLPNRPPEANDDVLAAHAGEVHEVDVLANDTDPDGDVLRVTSVTQGSQGTAAIGNNGKVIYTANASANGSDVLTYTVCDPWGVCDQAQVVITITPLAFERFDVAGGACSGGGASTFAALALGLLVIAVMRKRRNGVSNRQA